MALHKLSFDVTDAATQDASANVGAFVRAGTDGELIDSTSNALWVHLKASDIALNVELDHTDGDSVQIGDGTDIMLVNADGSINAVVSATNLDIRDLAFATDKVDVSGSSVSISGTVAVTQSTSPWVVSGTVELGATTLAALETIELGATTLAALENITVSASDLDIRDLSHSQDSIKIGDGTDFLAINGDGSINVVNSGDPGLANVAMLANAETVGTSAIQVIDVGDELASRKYCMFYNNGNRVAYIGPSGITTSTGFPIPPGSVLEARIGAAVDVYMIADAAGQNIRALQLS